MKGVTLVLRCQLCQTRHEMEISLSDKIKLPHRWVSRGVSHLDFEMLKLYPEWKGRSGLDVLPRLFCCKDHREAFAEAEKGAAIFAQQEGHMAAVAAFETELRKRIVASLDAVTALATVAREDGDGPSV